MIFYICEDLSGRKRIFGTQADAKACNPKFEQVDLPTDKAGYMAVIQDSFNQLHELSLAQPETAREPEEKRSDAPTTDTLVFPAEGPLSTSEQLRLRGLIDQHWSDLPFAYRCDVVGEFFNDIRLLRPRETGDE